MSEPSESEQVAAAPRERAEQRAGAWWRLPLLLALVLAAIVAARTTRVHQRGPEENSRVEMPAPVPGKSVALSIDFGDGQKREFDSVGWFPGMTVDDLMTAASRLPEGIRVGLYGDHERTMVMSIDDAYNEWGAGRNWTYQVNDIAADRGVAVYELEPGDRVLWTFGAQQ